MTSHPITDEHHRADAAYCHCWHCVMTEQLLQYIFYQLEPTDRALRPAGMAPAKPE